MSLLSQASAHTDQADLVILSHVETIRDQMQPATASAVASMIGGAPVTSISFRMNMLKGYRLLEFASSTSFQLSEIGAELLRRDLLGWSPSPREEERRTLELRAIVNGARA